MGRSPFEIWDDAYEDSGPGDPEPREIRCAFCGVRDLFWSGHPKKSGKFMLVDGEGKPHECLKKNAGGITDDFT